MSNFYDKIFKENLVDLMPFLFEQVFGLKINKLVPPDLPSTNSKMSLDQPKKRSLLAQTLLSQEVY
jgi:hypothetical protein